MLKAISRNSSFQSEGWLSCAPKWKVQLLRFWLSRSSATIGVSSVTLGMTMRCASSGSASSTKVSRCTVATCGWRAQSGLPMAMSLAISRGHGT